MRVVQQGEAFAVQRQKAEGVTLRFTTREHNGAHYQDILVTDITKF